MEKTAAVHWTAGLRFEAEAGQGGRLVMDDETAGPFRPMELVAVALAGCTAMDVISILRKKRQAVTRYAVHVRATQRDEHPRVFSDVVVEHEVEGDPLDAEAVRRSIELSASRCCPVIAILAAGTARISHRYLMRSGAGERRAEVSSADREAPGSATPWPAERAARPPRHAASPPARPALPLPVVGSPRSTRAGAAKMRPRPASRACRRAALPLPVVKPPLSEPAPPGPIGGAAPGRIAGRTAGRLGVRDRPPAALAR